MAVAITSNLLQKLGDTLRKKIHDSDANGFDIQPPALNAKFVSN